MSRSEEATPSVLPSRQASFGLYTLFSLLKSVRAAVWMSATVSLLGSPLERVTTITVGPKSFVAGIMRGTLQSRIVLTPAPPRP